jgi:hypothetical protein
MNIEVWPIAKPVPYARNARKIPQTAIDKVAGSIKEFGFRQPIVVDKGGVIVAGHTRHLAAQKLGLSEVPVHVASELTATQIKAYRLADNRVNQESSFDNELLALELSDLKLEDFALELTGFNPDELVAMAVQGKAESESQAEDDKAPVALDFAISETGDLWILGRHRLLCGDSTSVDVLTRLFDGAVPEIVFSDPPYGIDIVKGNKVGGGGATNFGKVGGGKVVEAKTYAAIANDDSTDVAREFYHACQSVGIKDYILWGGNYFTDFLVPSMCWLVWDKQNTGHFADVELAWTSFNKGAKLYKWLWNGMSRAGDHKTELRTRVHPTQKPVGLFEAIFQDFEFKTCFDGFLGSGSTLIACEKTNRQCFGTELSAPYVDVIVKRWQDFTGQEAHMEDGTTFAQLEARRNKKLSKKKAA